MAETPGNASFQLFTSLRYDPILLHSKENSTEMVSFTIPSPFYMLVYHRDRMLEAARHFEWNPVIQKLQDGKALEAALLAEVENRQRAKGGERTPLRVCCASYVINFKIRTKSKDKGGGKKINHIMHVTHWKNPLRSESSSPHTVT